MSYCVKSPLPYTNKSTRVGACWAFRAPYQFVTASLGRRGLCAIVFKVTPVSKPSPPLLTVLFSALCRGGLTYPLTQAHDNHSVGFALSLYR